MNPYFQTSQLTLYHGDCLEVMAGLPDKSIDFICTDLPYAVTACDWDQKIPLDKLWVQYKRLIKPKGAIALFGTQPFTSELVMSNRQWFRYEWIWDKVAVSNGFTASIRPQQCHESVCVFYKNQVLYNPQKRQGIKWSRGEKPTVKKHGVVGLITEGYTRTSDTTTEKFPKSIIQFSNANQTIKDHPTQKPVSLLQYLIKTYTNEGGTVLDSTCGSGSTLVAARDTGRKAIGIELDPHYVEVAAKRCSQLSIWGEVSA